MNLPYLVGNLHSDVHGLLAFPSPFDMNGCNPLQPVYIFYIVTLLKRTLASIGRVHFNSIKDLNESSVCGTLI